MKCYYEVLDVPRDADDAIIKTAYKKLALKWHPDKNLDNPDEAKAQFQLVQEAYSVLSDRQERAWYDNHREQILFASNRSYTDKSVDLFQYFTTSCFKGYGDDDGGFYTIYRSVFEQIAKEDMEFMQDKEDFCEIPTFGNSQSDYERVVGPFYAHWSNYSTKKSFVWLDPYNITEVRGGKVLKLMEKENKKVRQKAKKEWNEEVRNIVAFVRKRDKRVQIQIQLEKSKKLENRKKHEQISIQKRRERQVQLNSSGQAEWTKFDNVKSELEDIERHLVQEFGDQLTDSENEEEIFNNNLYCIACSKLFKNPKAFHNHEMSKKHKDKAAKIKQELLENISVASGHSDEGEQLLSPHSRIHDCSEFTEDTSSEACLEEDDEGDFDKNASGQSMPIKKKCKNKKKVQNLTTSDLSVDTETGYILSVTDNSDEEFTSSSKLKKKDLKKKRNKQNHDESNEPDHIVNSNRVAIEKDNILLVTGESDAEFTSSSKLKKKRNRQNNHESNKPDHVNANNVSNSTRTTEEQSDSTRNTEEQNHEKVLPECNSEILEKTQNEGLQKQKKLSKKSVHSSLGSERFDIGDIDPNHFCAVCKTKFPSKNKLFDHLKKTGHSVYIPKDTGKCKTKKNKSKTRDF